MSKKFKSQASSSRAASGALGSGAFGGFSSGGVQQEVASSSLSYIAEPPDLSQISDPQVVVAFKNLLKKDSTTKTKALEDLQGFVSAYRSNGSVPEDGLLDAWTNLYPRASIDASRRVRQLAHTIQGSIVSITGKRIARHIPKVVGSWLAGLYDNDKLVQRAAQESIITAFPAEEKRQGIWNVYRSSILDFVVDAVLHQTPQTLSDERTVRPDEADAKHSRVVATSIQLFNRLLTAVNAPNIPKDSVDSLVKNRTLWKFAHHSDPFVRRSLYELLNKLLSIDESYIDWRLMSSSILSKALSSSQRGSASEFSDLLLNATREHPELWTTEYTGKTPPAKRFLQYVKKGSEGASHIYWGNLHLLFKAIPNEILIPQAQGMSERLESAGAFLTAFHDGILDREEPKANLGPAWSAYLNTVMWVSTLFVAKDDRRTILQKFLCPVLVQFVLLDPEKSEWTINGPQARKICADCVVGIAAYNDSEILRSLWETLTDTMVHGLKVSSPGQSQGYKSSQDSICFQANRLFDLESEVLSSAVDSNSLDMIRSTFYRTAIPLLGTSREILRSRNGKPYGAAAIINEAIAKVPGIVDRLNDLHDLLAVDVPGFIFSPSAGFLVSTLFHSRGRNGFQSGLHQSIDALFEADSETLGTSGIRTFFSSVGSEDIESHEKLEPLIKKRLYQALQGDTHAWGDVTLLFKNPSLYNNIAPSLLRCIVDSLSSDERTLEALRGLKRIISESKEPVKQFATGADGPKLISKLLYLAESPVDEVSQLADSLELSVKGLINHEDSSTSTVEIIQHNFRHVGEESLSLDSLVTISEELLLRTPAGEKSTMLSQLLPARDQWIASLQPFLAIPPPHSASLISPLGGAVYLVNRSKFESPSARAKSVPRDSTQFSLVYRLSFYVTKLLSPHSVTDIGTDLSPLFLYLPLAVQLIDDDLNIAKSTGILNLDIPDLRDECAELVSEARLLIKGWIQGTSSAPAEGGRQPIVDFWEKQLGELGNDEPQTYRMADALARIIADADAMEPLDSAEPALQRGERIPGTSGPFTLPTTLAAYNNSLSGTAPAVKLCNRLVADLTDLDSHSESEGLRKMTAVNILNQENNLMENVATQRLVFFVKHLIQCLQSHELSHGLISESLKCLTAVFPFIKEIYGSHWSEILEIIASAWESGDVNNEEYIPVLHSSLRLFACLRGLSNEESNDDLEEAWMAAQKGHAETLVELMTRFDETHCPDLPWKITSDLLARQVSAINVDQMDDVSHVFSALSVQDRGIQRAAYNVLRRSSAKTQEAVSFNLALSPDTVVSLPDELLSLLLEAPTIGVLTQGPAQDSVWIEVRCFLLSWKAVFDRFVHASLPVRERYSKNIKEQECLPSLLEFMFDFLMYQRDKPIDASKFGIRTFEPDHSESADKETQWLLVHLYYLCLRYLPNLTKAWWVDSKKRVKAPIEAWTQKYISPLVIEDALNDVSNWFSTQDWTDEEQPLQIKVSHKSSEIVANIGIDEESPPTSLAFSLPPTYPLQQAMVIGRNRVAVDEKKWKNWMLTIQGVIMFSNGNLVDGLLAFRRNVLGALKGQGECPICCSVISSDMQTPNKRCATCKHTFHSDCLFRWFKTSNSSGCPLCRNNFLYS